MSLGLISRLKNTRVDYVCPECARAFNLPFDRCPACECDRLYKIVK